MKVRILLVLLATSLLSAVSSAQTPVPAVKATVQETNGAVLVNQGEQFVDAELDMVLKAGDRIMAMEKSNASVKYFEGCVIDIGV